MLASNSGGSATRRGLVRAETVLAAVMSSAASLPCFPVELLDIIVLYLLARTPSFASIAAFALVSRQFRLIALRRYFASLHIHSPWHWVRLGRICGIHGWVCSLSASSTSFRYKINDFARFTFLKTLELDFAGDGLSTQINRTTLLFKNIAADLTGMKLTRLPRIDYALLSLIASRFAYLERLELSCTERLDELCCWLCFEESSTCTVHSPIPDTFLSVEHLSGSFCNALAPLKRLETLFLGVYLSDVDVLVRHLEHCAAIVVASPRTPNFYPTPPFGPNSCTKCCQQHAAEAQERERLAKTLFLESLPSLVNLGFSSWFPQTACNPREETAPRD